MFGSSFRSEGDPRLLSASATSYDEPLKSPTLPYLEDAPQSPLPSPKSPKPAVVVVPGEGEGGVWREEEADDDDEDMVPLGYLRMNASRRLQPQKENGYLVDGKDADGVDSCDEKLLEHDEAAEEGALVDAPDVYDHGIPPATPSITVNGFQVRESPASSRSTHHTETEPVPKSLPLVLTPLQEYIYLDFDPVEMFTDLQEVAQGQYGSVYAARVSSGVLGRPDSVVAVKKVSIPLDGTPKIGQLQHELDLMSQVRHKHILGADGLFFDVGEGMLWIRMELMERSLADVVVLSDEGLQLEEPVIARFASDVSGYVNVKFFCDGY